MTDVHPSSIVEDGAELGDGVTIGPFCVVGKQVRLGNGVQVVSHATITGETRIGDGGRVFPFASIGQPPQDLKYKGESSRIEIGTNVVIREHVTINPGTEGGGLVTQIGNDCLLMVGAHVAHDCQVGNNVILVNNATLAGHVEVEDFAILGGLSAVHQFVRIGRHAMIGGMSGVEHDVIPYGSVIGNRAHLSGLNIVGLKRRGFSRDTIHEIRRAYRLIFASEGTMAERLEGISAEFSETEPVMEIVDFIANASKRQICTPLADDAA